VNVVGRWRARQSQCRELADIDCGKVKDDFGEAGSALSQTKQGGKGGGWCTDDDNSSYRDLRRCAVLDYAMGFSKER